MDIKELNLWLETEEGKKWGEQFKAPLLKNRDTLLSELKAVNGRLSEAEQRNAQTENNLLTEKAVLSNYLIDNELHRLLNNANVFEALIPDVANSLKNAYSITIQANGDDRTAIGKIKDIKGNETDAGLEDIINTWKRLPEGKSVIKHGNFGGGATGSLCYTSSVASGSLSGLSGQALAAMSDDEFKAIRSKELIQGSQN